MTIPLPQAITIQKETATLPIDKISEQFASLRIVDPQAERAMLKSMQKYGQQTPVVVCRIEPGSYALLDGFKRLRAGRQLGRNSLTVRFFEASVRAGKAAILQLNRVGKSISSMEEAMVVHSLCHEDGLSQVEIATLVGRHKSWVSRRIALIARLSDEAQESIGLGLLPASLGSELARLQRCNQHQLLESIRKHHLTWRETRKVVTHLLTRPQWEHEAILRDPRAVDAKEEVDTNLERGLSPQAKDLHRRLLTLERQCLQAALSIESTPLAQFETDEETRLRNSCRQALTSLDRLRQALISELTPEHPSPPGDLCR